MCVCCMCVGKRAMNGGMNDEGRGGEEGDDQAGCVSFVCDVCVRQKVREKERRRGVEVGEEQR